MGCIKLHHQYFGVYKQLQSYVDLKQCTTYFSMIDTLKESFLNEKMYSTFISQKEESMQKSFMTTLQQMENEPIFIAVEYIYDTFVELEKMEQSQEKDHEPNFKTYLLGLWKWFIQPDTTQTNGNQLVTKPKDD